MNSKIVTIHFSFASWNVACNSSKMLKERKNRRVIAWPNQFPSNISKCKLLKTKLHSIGFTSKSVNWFIYLILHIFRTCNLQVCLACSGPWHCESMNLPSSSNRSRIVMLTRWKTLHFHQELIYFIMEWLRYINWRGHWI